MTARSEEKQEERPRCLSFFLTVRNLHTVRSHCFRAWNLFGSLSSAWTSQSPFSFSSPPFLFSVAFSSAPPGAERAVVSSSVDAPALLVFVGFFFSSSLSAATVDSTRLIAAAASVSRSEGRRKKQVRAWRRQRKTREVHWIELSLSPAFIQASCLYTQRSVRRILTHRRKTKDVWRPRC